MLKSNLLLEVSTFQFSVFVLPPKKIPLNVFERNSVIPLSCSKFLYNFFQMKLYNLIFHSRKEATLLQIDSETRLLFFLLF